MIRIRTKFTLYFAALLSYLLFSALPVIAAPYGTSSTSNLPVFSDFDGDNKIDQAELFSNGAQKSIRVSLGRFAWKSLFFDSGALDRGHLVSDDIDSDGDEDLIWISQDSPETVVMWLGDGRGDFSIATAAVRERLLTLMRGRPQAQIADDFDDDETACDLQVTKVPALESCFFLIHPENCQRYTLRREPACRSLSSLFVVLKRGPPSRLS